MPKLADATHSSNNKSTSRPNVAINQTAQVRRIRKAWLFRALAIVFPLGIVCLAEFYLRLTNVGIDPTLVLRSSRELTGSIHSFNPRVDVADCSIDLRGPEPRGFALPKPPGTFRVVVVGIDRSGLSVRVRTFLSSAFGTHSTKQLNDQKVEVLNAGIIGISTTPLVDLVNQCIKARPDLVVRYAGHNDFYGVGGLATNANITAAGIMFRQQRRGQLLSSYAHSEVDSKGAATDLIESFPAEYRISNGSELIRQAREIYRRNVSKIVNICDRHNIPIVLCGVASNLRDHNPLTVGDEAKILADAATQVQLVGDENRVQQVQNI